MGVTFKATVNGDKAVVVFSAESSVAAPQDAAEVPDASIEEPVPLALPPITKSAAVRRRFLKVAVYTTLGVVLSVAGYLTLTVLTGFELPSWLVTVGTVLVSGIAGAVHKSVNWSSAGVEAPEVPDATVPPLSLPSP